MTKPHDHDTSGVIDLSALTDALPAQERGHDESLLAVGVAPLSAVRPVPARRKFAERALPVATVLLAFTSIALAAHEAEHHRDDHGSAAAPSTHLSTSKSPATRTPEAHAAESPPEIAEPNTTSVSEGESAGVDVQTTPSATLATSTEGSRTSAAGPRLRRTGVGRTSFASRSDSVERVTSSGDLSFDELMRQAAGTSVVSAPSGEPAESSLPLRPSTSQVSASFRSVGAALRSCDPAGDGVVTARVVMNGASGRPSSARVEGASGPIASCMREALMDVRVEPFAQVRLEVSFPYRL